VFNVTALLQVDIKTGTSRKVRRLVLAEEPCPVDVLITSCPIPGVLPAQVLSPITPEDVEVQTESMVNSAVAEERLQTLPCYKPVICVSCGYPPASVLSSEAGRDTEARYEMDIRSRRGSSPLSGLLSEAETLVTTEQFSRSSNGCSDTESVESHRGNIKTGLGEVSKKDNIHNSGTKQRRKQSCKVKRARHADSETASVPAATAE
jgi:hypothetical protein